MIRMLTDPDELDRVLGPVMEREGFEAPKRGCYVAAVEFDERGEVIAYQMVQNALFLEGMYARDGGAHLRALHNAAVAWAREAHGVKHIFTFTRMDKTGERIARCAERLGLVPMPWKIFRRTL